MTIATATEVQNNFGRFLKMVQEGQEVVIIKNLPKLFCTSVAVAIVISLLSSPFCY